MIPIYSASRIFTLYIAYILEIGKVKAAAAAAAAAAHEASIHLSGYPPFVSGDGQLGHG